MNQLLQDELDFVLKERDQKEFSNLEAENTKRIEKAKRIVSNYPDAYSTDISMRMQQSRASLLQKYIGSNTNPGPSDALRDLLEEFCQRHNLSRTEVFDDYFSLAKFRSLTRAQHQDSARYQREIGIRTPSFQQCEYVHCKDIDDLFALQPGKYTFFMGYYFVMRDTKAYPGGDPNRLYLQSIGVKEKKLEESVCLTVWTRPLFEDETHIRVGHASAFREGNLVEFGYVLSADFPKPFSFSLGKLMYAILFQYFAKDDREVQQRLEKNSSISSKFASRFGFSTKSIPTNNDKFVYYKRDNMKQKVVTNIRSWAKGSVSRVLQMLTAFKLKPFQLFTAAILEFALKRFHSQELKGYHSYALVKHDGTEIKENFHVEERKEIAWKPLVVGGLMATGIGLYFGGYEELGLVSTLVGSTAWIALQEWKWPFGKRLMVPPEKPTLSNTIQSSSVDFQLSKERFLSEKTEELSQQLRLAVSIPELVRNFTLSSHLELLAVKEKLLDSWWLYLNSQQPGLAKQYFEALLVLDGKANEIGDALPMEDEIMFALRSIHLTERFFGRRRPLDISHQVSWYQLLTTVKSQVADVVGSTYPIDPAHFGNQPRINTYEGVIEVLDRLFVQMNTIGTLEDLAKYEETYVNVANQKMESVELVRFYEMGLHYRFHDLRCKKFWRDVKTWKSYERALEEKYPIIKFKLKSLF